MSRWTTPLIKRLACLSYLYEQNTHHFVSQHSSLFKFLYFIFQIYSKFSICWNLSFWYYTTETGRNVCFITNCLYSGLSIHYTHNQLYLWIGKTICPFLGSILCRHLRLFLNCRSCHVIKKIISSYQFTSSKCDFIIKVTTCLYIDITLIVITYL